MHLRAKLITWQPLVYIRNENWREALDSNNLAVQWITTKPSTACHHDDVIKWKYFPHYWPFVRGIHRSPVKSPHKGQWGGALMLSLICALNKRLSKQSWGWWFETPSHSLWRHSYYLQAHDMSKMHVAWLSWIRVSAEAERFHIRPIIILK